METPRTAAASLKQAVGGKGLVFVGSFTSRERKARGEGIDAYRIDPHSSTWDVVDQVRDLVNPSYLVADPVGEVLYAVHGDAEYASAYRIDPTTGRLQALGQAAAGGRNGVSATLDSTRRFLFVANYANGSIGVLPIKPDGGLENAVQCVMLPGPIGPHRVEQTMSHPHHTVMDPSGRFLLVPDKGLDRVHVLAFDPAHAELSVKGFAATRPGAGPRHIAFHPRLARAFVVDEIDSTVTTCAWNADAGELSPLHVVPTLSPNFFGVSTAAEILVTPCGRWVYVSNRGQDAVTQFRFDEITDQLNVVGWTPTQGRDPRFMTLSPKGDCLLVANEQGDNIAIFDIEPASGRLVLRRVVSTASPSTIAFV
ncbi:MAG: lactonase family protein [Rhodopila sp.]|nr:lactonase family protein [Rhodopila sp.]